MRREEIRRLLVACDGVSVMREAFDAPAVRAMARVLETLCREEAPPREVSGAVSGLLGELANEDGPLLLPDAWKSSLIKAILDSETLFGMKAERGDLTPFIEAQATRDLASLRRLFSLDSKTLLSAAVNASHEIDDDSWTNWDLGYSENEGLFVASSPSSARREVAEKFARSGEWGELVDVLAGYFRVHGAGFLGKYRAFRWEDGGLRPVPEPDPTVLEDLIGYERERGGVIRNTERFARRLPAHHALLYGPPGTGKSSTVKAVFNRYSDEGLRLVEVAKERLSELPRLLDVLRGRGLRFIVFVDDLSFEESEVEYKSLKALIEGSIESPPENVRVYATSNRRNLIRESFSEREGDDVHARDTMGEKLSLAARFGLRVTFLLPDQKTYLGIVRGIAAERGLRLTQEQTRLLEENALNRERWGSGRSGRAARQAVDDFEAGF